MSELSTFSLPSIAISITLLSVYQSFILMFLYQLVFQSWTLYTRNVRSEIFRHVTILCHKTCVSSSSMMSHIIDLDSVGAAHEVLINKAALILLGSTSFMKYFLHLT